MIPIEEMTQGELAAYVQAGLRERGIEVVLSGGAVVSIYSQGEYVSLDIDLVNSRFAHVRDIESVMIKLGFSRTGRHFEHPESKHIVEFPPGPLAIGDQKIESVATRFLRTGTLRLLSPTDCVMDRLAHFFHWNDRQALAQAQMVASRHEINLTKIKEWSGREGMLVTFMQIAGTLDSDSTRIDASNGGEGQSY